MRRSDSGLGAKGRVFVGSIFLAFVWVSYLVRLIFGVGIMHDLQGQPAPAQHYLVGAVVVTAAVLAWIFLGAWLARRVGHNSENN
jgi:hypothetical protein